MFFEPGGGSSGQAGSAGGGAGRGGGDDGGEGGASGRGQGGGSGVGGSAGRSNGGAFGSGGRGGSGRGGSGPEGGTGGNAGSSERGGSGGQGGQGGASGTGGIGGESGNGGSGGEAGAGAGGEAGAGAEDCNGVVNAAPVVYEVQGGDLLPTAAGGVFADGTYYLTSWEIIAPYIADTGRARAITVVVSGAGTRFDVVRLDSGGAVSRLSANVLTEDETVVMSPICPEGPAILVGYTATESSFSFIYAEGDEHVEVYTKQ